MKVNIKRFDGERWEFRTYSVEVSDNPTVLELLIKIKEEIDPTLTFRAMCRSSICGTCGVKVNGEHRLACNTRVSEEEITIEPADGLMPLRDLVTDHGALISRIRSLPSWVKDGGGASRSFTKAWDCILCGICDSLCPPLIEGTKFAGPMAITRFFRSEGDIKEWVDLLKGCVHCSNCTLFCPKSCMPERWVTALEGKLEKMGYIQKSGGEFDFLGF